MRHRPPSLDRPNVTPLWRKIQGAARRRFAALNQHSFTSTAVQCAHTTLPAHISSPPRPNAVSVRLFAQYAGEDPRRPSHTAAMAIRLPGSAPVLLCIQLITPETTTPQSTSTPGQNKVLLSSPRDQSRQLD